MDIITTLLVVLVLTLLLILWKKTSRDARYPPGPPTLPFLGNLNMNTADMVGEFRRFRQRYGDVFSLILGTKTVVVVSGYDTLKELFVKHADVVSERPDAFVFKEIGNHRGKCYEIVSKGEIWKLISTSIWPHKRKEVKHICNNKMKTQSDLACLQPCEHHLYLDAPME